MPWTTTKNPGDIVLSADWNAMALDQQDRIDKDGSVSLTANWDIGDGFKILADQISARDAAGLLLTEDGDTGIFIQDSTGYAGILTLTPRKPLDILDTAGAQLRLTYTDNSVYTDFTVDSGGDLTITPTGSLAILPVTDIGGQVYNVMAYGAAGDGIEGDRTEINDTATAAAGGTINFPAGTYKVESSITLDENLHFEKGAMLSIDVGQTVTITGIVTAGPWQIFSGSGDVSFTGPNVEVYAEWWGAAVGGGDDTAAMQAAIDSLTNGGTVRLLDGQYDITGLNIPQFVKVISNANTVIETSGAIVLNRESALEGSLMFVKLATGSGQDTSIVQIAGTGAVLRLNRIYGETEATAVKTEAASGQAKMYVDDNAIAVVGEFLVLKRGSATQEIVEIDTVDADGGGDFFTYTANLDYTHAIAEAVEVMRGYGIDVSGNTFSGTITSAQVNVDVVRDCFAGLYDDCGAYLCSGSEFNLYWIPDCTYAYYLDRAFHTDKFTSYIQDCAVGISIYGVQSSIWYLHFDGVGQYIDLRHELGASYYFRLGTVHLPTNTLSVVNAYRAEYEALLPSSAHTRDIIIAPFGGSYFNNDIYIDGDSPELTLDNYTHENTDYGRENTLTFIGQKADGTSGTLAQIEAAHDGTGDDLNGILSFKTHDGASVTTAMTIDSANNVGIGLTGPASPLDVLSTSTVASSKAVNILHSGAVGGTGYGLYVDKTGASTLNYGIYATASGGTQNVAGYFNCSGVPSSASIYAVGRVSINWPTVNKYPDCALDIMGIYETVFNAVYYAAAHSYVQCGAFGKMHTDGTFYDDDGVYNIYTLADLNGGAPITTTIAAIGAMRTGANNTGTIYLQPYNAGAAVNAMVLTNAGRIGIGITGPAGLFHIATDTTAVGVSIFEQASADADSYDLIFKKTRGTVASPTVITTADELGTIQFAGYSGAGGYVTGAAIKAISAGTIATTRVPGLLSFWTGTDAAPTVLTERMRIDRAGNIGLGYTAPASKVHVAFGAGTGAIAPTTITKANNYITLGGNEYNTNSYRMIGFGYAVGTYSPAYIGFQEISIASFSYGDLIFGTRSTTGDTLAPERMRINYLGNVGIGTNAPGTLVELMSTAPYLTIHNSTEENGDYGREGRIVWKGEQVSTAITTLGIIEIAHDGGDDDQKGILTISLNDGADGDAPTAYFTIDSAGNVGIGETSPAYKLDVEGTIYCTDIVIDTVAGSADGQVWTATGAGGVGQWEALPGGGVPTYSVGNFGDGDLTPDISSATAWKTHATGGTITNLDSGGAGDIRVIYFIDSATTIQDNANLNLQGALDFTGAVGDTLTMFCLDGTYWYELARSVNS